ncbi:GvpL/GvpF family gas vesicle protein [Streptomyces cyaneofuscatus]|uniref:GvpL/GvpF family gas vesicle protein n=1 Tax=Streptomyces TaxID=1883 RepID=UPI000978EA89|nr:MULTISPECIES: GvpL/GvpF family gas vesicle protein [unclassified Streptomyces]ONI54785.1 Gas vesicle synthesis protein GvpL/GvpF [Streptomyces sp. IB2014 011-1]RDV52983.1 gas vesicle protein [Streptomyces sp. IB2014 011-12]
MTHPAPRDRAPDAAGVTYVFAVCRGTRAVNTADVTGLAGMPGGAAVRLLPSGPLTAVVQTVPADDFTDEVWQARLSDPQEIERYARAHHEVVSAAAVHGPAVPLPLATLYHDDDRARRALDDEAHRFHGVLKRIAHHAEWGVKVYEPEPPAAQEEREPAPVGDGGREAPAPGAGLAYLNRKRGVQERRERRREQALSVAESVDAELCELAAASRRLRTHAAVPGGDGRVHVLNATYLVADQRAEELAALVRALGERTGTRIELTGPWVPYSFVGEV